MDEEKREVPGAVQDGDIDTLVALLDGFTQSGDSRIKVDVVESNTGNEGNVDVGGLISRHYHHGRCDIGSPWACGTAFDVIE